MLLQAAVESHGNKKVRGDNLYETAVVLGCGRDRRARVGKTLPPLGSSLTWPRKIFELLLLVPTDWRVAE